MAPPIPPPPPGLTYIAVITPSLNLLIINTVWGAMLIPLLLVLFFFSNPKIRRRPLFIMNAFSVTMGIVVAAINMQLYVTNILQPTAEFPARTLLAYLGMILFLPVFMDCILAFRLYAIYPPRNTPTFQLALIFIPLILFKITRIVNLTIFMVKFGTAILTPQTTSAIANFQVLWDTAPYPKVEWIFQVVDNCYASGLFLWKIGRGRKSSNNTGVIKSYDVFSRSGDKLKSLFYLALSSFVFPCMLSIVQVAIVFNDHNFFIGAYIFVTNLYVEIIGVLLATIWVAKTQSDASSAATSDTKMSSMAYRAGSARFSDTNRITTATNPENMWGNRSSTHEVELEVVTTTHSGDADQVEKIGVVREA